MAGDVGELREKLFQAVVEGDEAAAEEYTRRLVERGLGPREIVSEVLVPAMRRVGELYEKGEYFIPELVMSAEAFRRSMEVLRPLIRGQGESPARWVAVFGTVRGDIHELGKNLAAAVFEAEGFHVVDLGVDVPPEKFAEAVEKYNARVVGMSALMTTTMLEQRNVIEELKKRGLRDKVIVIAGGAPVTEEWVREIGADVWGRDAFEAVKIVKRMLGEG
ncbi:cobalamin B12-binding domain-containing protein [Thermofilum pendens]|uniref:Trimethylamine corrinoid protein n=1 Tax=Thermofilum pendens (strain DSM 2475 / Hrk 5) TaxID=368408 RepID=A1S085_THEPD|nr:corrinoid protein [Thermofilum pendens]ABL78865.1 trimethylamine corrinoid protein [Thermofilum pendens Hrk 5]